ncbi:MAG: hypothetical protein CL910_05270 [Deltaproteobacteria bacterium]|jgi:hypothetical protein|nr:hypothetical protein [Deltaproteobacteria bacterium]
MGIRRVAIVGDGPAGCALATHLARRGLRVALFSRGRPGGLVVGESLVPAAVPLLRELGVEDEVRSYSQRKPGATFVVRDGDALGIDFAEACAKVPGYAYNVPRARFDDTLLAVCRESGAEILDAAAGVERDGATGRPVLVGESREQLAASLGGPPDFLVDATGRHRLLARLLDLPASVGPRRDDALFAHFEGIPVEEPGHVYSDRLERGWCWRIPLPGVVSMGVVLPREVTRALGPDREAQLDALCRSDPYLAKLTGGARRVSQVLRYTNYQLTTRRAVGEGWALVGDAFGFVDPIFSSGVYLALQGARDLADAITRGRPRDLRRYDARHRDHLVTWQRAVDTYYDGRFFALLRLRGKRPERGPRRWLHHHVSRHVTRVFTGESSRGGYSARVLDLIAERGLPRDQEPRVL